ncbi:DUF5074 domain-containing protein [Psychroflexus tropicus]|uniref:DUF5074 domain-containing protein n=1 Tax=Psychroflexus tropicus TaxID=197345 RepID=UPI0003751D79|nr:DUF5074 domain-containing protein [Psychroflexus tropicus]
MKNNYLGLLLVMLALFPFKNIAQTYNDGVFILNEGNFGAGNASVSFLNDNGTLSNGIFTSENPDLQVGDTAQSMAFNGEEIYIVANGSNRITVVDRLTFAEIATIETGLNNPRYVAFDEQSAYVTNWGDGTVTDDDFVAVIDRSTYQVTETIPITEGPEEILRSGNSLFVAHQGGFGYGNTISVIDLSDANSISEIQTGDVPNSLEIDENFLYVLCGGVPDFTGNPTAGKLQRFDLNDFSNVVEFDFEVSDGPNFLEVENGIAYYVNSNSIFRVEFSSASLPESPFVDTSGSGLVNTYGMDFIDDVFYVADAKDFVADGEVFTFDASGNFQTSYAVGKLPISVYRFNADNLSIDDNPALVNLSLYPNPAQNRFYLTNAEDATVTIYDMNGRLVGDFTYSNSGIGISQLNAGIYVVNIKKDAGFATKKLIID